MTAELYEVLGLHIPGVTQIIVGDRGIVAVGTTTGGGQINAIDYFTISSTGNASDFGDYSAAASNLSAASNVTRCCFFGGREASEVAHIRYVTISTPGNSTTFGSLHMDNSDNAGCSNGINDRGLCLGGFDSGPVYIQRIDYVAISTTGNADDFGDLIVGQYYHSGCSNKTNERGIAAGGLRPSLTNVIQYVTINSLGNAADFGDLTAAHRSFGGASNWTNERGIFQGGYIATQVLSIDYITINSAGNASDFGDLTIARYGIAGTSNGLSERGVSCGGHNGTDSTNIIDYVTISTTGNASDFGDLVLTHTYAAASSGN